MNLTTTLMTNHESAPPSESTVAAQQRWETTGEVPTSYVQQMLSGQMSTSTTAAEVVQKSLAAEKPSRQR